MAGVELLSSPFAWGVFGSVAVEVGAALKACVALEGKMPPMYKRPFYLISRTFFALCAGGLALGIGAVTFSNAFVIGVAFPLILEKLQQGVSISDATSQLDTP